MKRGDATHEMNLQPANAVLIDDTIAYYQTGSWLFSHGSQKELSAVEFAQHVPPIRSSSGIKPPLAETQR